MRSSRASLFPLFLAAIVAGCAGTDPSTDVGSGPPQVPTGESQGLDAPTWSLGDHWAYRTSEGQTITFVVAEDLGLEWRVRSTDPELAFSEAAGSERPAYDISTLGPIRKADLAGSQGAERVRHFDFPLTAEKTWTTTWDGRPFSVRVVEADNASARMEASTGGNVVYAYTYEAAVGWFADFAVLGPDGSTLFAFVDVERGANFTGELPAWTYEAVIDREFTSGGAVQGNFEVGEQLTDVFLDLGASCADPGVAEYAIGPPQGLAGGTDGFEFRGPCPHTVNMTGSIGSEPRGTWGYFLGGTADDWHMGAWAATRTLTMEPFAAS